MRARALAVGLIGLWSPTAAGAQATASPGLSVEVTTDDRRRGLSWSGGKPTVSASGYLPLGAVVELGATVTGLRGSVRHGGADVGFDLSAEHRHDLGPFTLSGGLMGHLFTGRSDLSYGEALAGVDYALGPARLGVGASYAPRQGAIGGDNLYLSVRADVGVPGTPWRIGGGVGRSSGSVREADRAARLRPEGGYWDYRLSLSHVRGPLTVGAQLSATSGGQGGMPSPYRDRHGGARAALSLRFDL